MVVFLLNSKVRLIFRLSRGFRSLEEAYSLTSFGVILSLAFMLLEVRPLIQILKGEHLITSV
jgi:hypothetical protein